MSWEQFTVKSYLEGELQFWESVGTVKRIKEDEDAILKGLNKRFNNKANIAVADKRFNSLLVILKLIKPNYLESIKRKLIKQFGSKYKNVFNMFQEKMSKAKNSKGLGFDWIEVGGIAVTIITTTIAELESKKDDNWEQGDNSPPDIIEYTALRKLIEKNAYLSCDEIEYLNYESWTTYLFMAKAMGNFGEYVKTLVCSRCSNLERLPEDFDYDYNLILPKEISFLGASIFASKLEKCEIS